MITIDKAIVEAEITKVVEELNDLLEIGAVITPTFCPGSSGFTSQALLDMFPSIEDALGIVIPHNKYIFYDEKTRRQLTITEATQKLIEVAKNGTKN